jgi:hypothetical protein
MIGMDAVPESRWRNNEPTGSVNDVTANMGHTSPVKTIAEGRGCGTMDGDGNTANKRNIVFVRR